MSLLNLSAMRRRVAAAAASWSPADDTPLFWVDTAAAFAGGRLWQNSTKTTAVTAVSDPVGAIVQEASIGYDLTQTNTARRYYLAQMATDSQYALGSDGVDDALLNGSIAFSAGAKTIGFRCEYYASLGATESDALMSFGGSSAMTRIYAVGTSSASKGLNFITDVGVTSKTMRRYSGFTVTSGVAFTVVLAYNGGAIDSTASYRLFVNGSEVTIDATSTGLTSSATSTLLCLTVASAPASALMSKVFVCTGDLSAKIADMQAYLVA